MPIINIAKDDKKSLYIDTSDITAVEFHKGRGVSLSIYNSKTKLLDQESLRDANVDPDDLFKKLTAAGIPLVRLQLRPTLEGDTVDDCFINPAAVTYATISVPDEKKGTQSISFGVKGVGTKASYGDKPEVINAFIAAVRAVKLLREYKPDEASARWHKQSKTLYIDPASVTGLDDNGSKVVVHFADNKLYVEIFRVDESKLVNEIKPGPKSDLEIYEAFNQAAPIKDRMDKAARVKFTGELAAANGTLIPVISTEAARFFSRTNVGGVNLKQHSHTGQWVLSIILASRGTAPNGRGVVVRANFDSEQKALAAMEALEGKGAPPAAPRQRTAPAMG